jgi:hypothetical protein
MPCQQGAVLLLKAHCLKFNQLFWYVMSLYCLFILSTNQQELQGPGSLLGYRGMWLKLRFHHVINWL